MANDCKSVFNRLSKADRIKLRGAALSTAITGFIKDDTAAYPWRYPLYATYLFIVATPLPFPFASTLLLGATALWARYGRSDAAQRLNSRLKDAFSNQAKLVCDNRESISPHPEKAGTFRIRNLSLAWKTTVRTCVDTKDATVAAWNALKKFVCA